MLSSSEVGWVCVVVPAMLCIFIQCLSEDLLACPLDTLPERPWSLSDIGLGRKEYLILSYLVQMHLAPKN